MAGSSPFTAMTNIFTGRNEVLAKVIFSQACVCPLGVGACSKFSGGVPAPNFRGGVPAPNFRGVPAPNFRGGGGLLQIFGGVPAPNFGGVPAPNFRGGACSKFSGGVPAPNFGGVPAPNFRGGVPAPNFWGGACSKFSGGGACSKFSGGSPIFGIRSTFGRYASYWNAFLLSLNSVNSVKTFRTFRINSQYVIYSRLYIIIICNTAFQNNIISVNGPWSVTRLFSNFLHPLSTSSSNSLFREKLIIGFSSKFLFHRKLPVPIVGSISL